MNCLHQFCSWNLAKLEYFTRWQLWKCCFASFGTFWYVGMHPISNNWGTTFSQGYWWGSLIVYCYVLEWENLKREKGLSQSWCSFRFESAERSLPRNFSLSDNWNLNCFVRSWISFKLASTNPSLSFQNDSTLVCNSSTTFSSPFSSRSVSSSSTFRVSEIADASGVLVSSLQHYGFLEMKEGPMQLHLASTSILHSHLLLVVPFKVWMVILSRSFQYSDTGNLLLLMILIS